MAKKCKKMPFFTQKNLQNVKKFWKKSSQKVNQVNKK